MKKQTRYLANRLTASFTLTAALPLVVISLVFGWVFLVFSRDAVAARQKSVIEVGKAYVERYFDDLFKEMELMGGIASAQKTGWAETISLVCRRSNENYVSISMTRDNGMEFVRFDGCQRSVFLSDRSREEAFFRAQRGEFFVGNVSFTQADEPIVTISFSTKAEGGQPVVIIARIMLGNIWQPLNELEVGDGGYIYIVDRLGNLIGYRDPQAVQKAQNLSMLPSVAPLIAKGEGVSAASYRGLLGEEVVGSSILVERLNWGLALEQPVSQIYAARNRLALITLLIILGFTAAAMTAARYLTRSIVTPIQRLAQGAEAVAAGNFNVSLQAEADDEIGLTANAFNLMTNRLRELIGTLEQRVAERTAKMERRNRELALAAKVGQNVSQAREMQSMLSGALEIIREFFDLYHAQIFLFDPQENELVLEYGVGEADAQTLSRNRRLPVDESSLNGRAALTKRPVIVLEGTDDSAALPSGVRSEMVVPLLAGDTLVGTLDAQGSRSDSLDEESLSAFEPMAAQIAIAIQNARLLQETLQARAEVEKQAGQTREALEQVEEQARQTQAALREAERQARLTQKISDAGLLFNRAADLQELVKAALETLDIPEMNRAVLEIFRYNSENEIGSVEVLANWWSGWGMRPTAIGTRYTAAELPLIGLYLTESPIFIEDAFNDERIDGITLQTVQRLNIHAVAIMPLFAGIRQIGVLLLESDQVYRFKEDETRLFSAMAPSFSTVLENLRQFERARKQAERQAALNLISQKIQNATSVEAALQVAARELGRALDLPLTVAQLNMKDRGEAER